MAWELDAGSIATGVSVQWAFWWGDRSREYRGIQVVQAKPEPVRSDDLTIWYLARLRVSETELQLVSSPEGWVYRVLVTSTSRRGARYKLRGQKVD